MYSFEPNPRDMMALVALSRHWDAIGPIDLGLSNAWGKAFLSTRVPLGCARIIEDEDAFASHRLLEISTTTLDTFVTHNSLAVDIIKIDTEGWERQVLEGAAETLRRDHPTIVMSAYHRPGMWKFCPRWSEGFAPTMARPNTFRRRGIVRRCSR